jgi:hypothetical protein
MIKENYTMLMISVVANGFCNLGIFSVCFEMAVHLAKSYNVGEATNVGFINVISNLVGFLLVLGLTPLLNYYAPLYVFISSAIFLVILVIALGLIFMVKAKNKE